MMPFKPSWQAALDRLCNRVLQIREAVGNDWPYHCDPLTGQWDTTQDGDWCGGHWVECLRIVGELGGDRHLLNESADRTERLRPYLERDDMFRGHRFYYSAARQYAWTGDARFRTLALAGAWAVRSMAIPVNGAMPIRTQVQVRSTTLSGRDKVCVDNVHPNLILDWWALKETGDATFEQGARRHLDLTERDFVLQDGSTIEFADYDLDTGRQLRHYTLLGAHDDSCWSRGQAWAIAGYLRAYEALGDARYLAIGKRLLDYWTAHSPADGVPPWDFKDPALQGVNWTSATPLAGTEVPIDTSAAAVVVEQLARLALHDNRPVASSTSAASLSTPASSATAPVLERLEPMLDGLVARVDAQGRLLEGCFNQPKRYANRSELIWGSAYLLFSLYALRMGRVVE
ncbi:MAG: hypothetical protein ACO26U_04985 [Burkholderiaceae bacterium]